MSDAGVMAPCSAQDENKQIVLEQFNLDDVTQLEDLYVEIRTSNC